MFARKDPNERGSGYDGPSFCVMDDVHIGSLYHRAPLSSSYDIAWLDNPEEKPLDPEIPLQTGEIASIYVHAFFENLLPEGDQRRIIGVRHHVSTVFGLLAAVGGDTVGSIVLLPSGQTPQPPLYRLMDWNQIDKLIDGGGNNADATEQTGEAPDDPTKPRLSISGAQYKLLISLNQFGMPLLPMGGSPSTHILIPIAIQETMPHLVPAEKIIAERIGLKITHIVQKMRSRLLPTAKSDVRN